MERNKGLGQVILQRESHLPWPDTRSAILQEHHPLNRYHPEVERGIAAHGVEKERQRLTVRGFNGRFSRVSRTAYLPAASERPAQELRFGGRHNHMGFTYRHHMISRIRARALENPQVTFTGWAALRILGLPYWVNDMPVQILAAAGGRKPRTLYQPHIVVSRCGWKCAVRADWRAEFHDLPAETQCATGGIAVSQALRDVLTQNAKWWLPDLRWLEGKLGLSSVEIRAVQLLDAVRRFLPHDALDASDVFVAGQVNRKRVVKLVELSTPLADSPIESLLRLLLRSVLPDLRPQVVLMDSSYPDLPVATADLWSPSARIAVFYDGDHHDDPQQRHIDARVDRDLRSQGIHVLRFTKWDLRDPVSIVDSVARAARLGNAAQG